MNEESGRVGVRSTGPRARLRGMDPPRRSGAAPPIKLAIRDRLSTATVNVGLARDMAADTTLRDRLRRALDALDEANRLLAAYEAGHDAAP